MTCWEQAYEKSIPVFSYDELIMDTDKVNYFVTFDTRKAGKMVGDSIIKKMDLEKASEEKRTLSIEFLMAHRMTVRHIFFYNGVRKSCSSILMTATHLYASLKSRALTIQQ